MLRLPQNQASFWRVSAAKVKYPVLEDDFEVDTVVVGGGISGLSAAYLLKQAGQTVAVVEKDTIGSGTTGHTTGKVTSQHGLIYDDLRRRLGDKAARTYGQVNQTAVGQIARLIRKEKIDCGFTRADNYVFTADPKQLRQFRQEAKTAARYGLPASFETSFPLPFAIIAAVKFSAQAYMNAQAYINGLAKAVTDGGSFVFENSRVITIHDGRRPYVRTASAKIRAKNIIVATNVPTFPLMARGGYCIREYPHKSYIVACEAKSYPKGMYISPDKNHYSILPIAHKGKRLLLVGGSNHIPGLGFGQRRHYKELADYAQQQLQATKVKYIWSARDYMAYDSLPLAGKLYTWSKHLYTVTAFRKWGLSNSMASATILRDLITGQPNPAAEVYDPHRPSVVASIPRTIAQTFK